MLGTNRIADLFNVKRRFLRSTHLERDFADRAALRGYIVTPPVQEGFERLIQGLAPTSSQRAWRVTADYGTGKSSFALALAHLFRHDGREIPAELRKCVDFRTLGLEQPNLLPVLVTGTRASLSSSLRTSLARALEAECRRGKPPQIIAKLREKPANSGDQSGTEDIALIDEAVGFLRQSGKADGLVIILDELGKFLEFAALYPERQDIYLLQMLAESAARSADAPIFIVGLLHQGFQAYAEQLSLSAQREWEKVAGRYEEILFNQPLEQTASLVASALNIQRDKLPRGATRKLEEEMTRTVQLGWYGLDAVKHRLASVAPEIFPLHPTVIPVLVKLFSRFGQNERSLFSFLLSGEPFALQSFAEQPAKADRFYRLHHLYDFARAAFGHRLALQTFRSHWNQIESVVESFPRDQVVELQILKTAAILNLINSPKLLASEDAIALAVDDSSEDSISKVRRALTTLQREKSILYYRGEAGGYCLWPHTSVNLERAYQDARDAVPVPQRIGPLIRDKLETRPLVARRHYIETGNLRHFDVQFVTASELQSAVAEPTGADGRVVVALCETEPERKEAMKLAAAKSLAQCKDVMIAIPQPLQGLGSLIVEVQRWEWVLANVPELNHDTYACEEATRQLEASRHVLNRRLLSYVGLRQFTDALGLDWYYRGNPLKLGTGRALLEKLSSVCDKLYPDAPRIQNELVNRRELSSAAAAARLRLIERLLAKPGEPYLGMDPATKPPEMSMYLSVLQEAGLHRSGLAGWAAHIPDEHDDPCCVRPVLMHLQRVLEASEGRRLKVTDLLNEMTAQPFGVRNGLRPLLLAVFAVIHEQDVAFYDQGSFVKQLTGQEFHRVIKAPEHFEMQYCRVAGVRTVVFEQLFKVLNPHKTPKSVDLLDVVRPLCVFAAQLPDFARKTGRISKMAAAVRDALLRAEEPATLLFQTLPEACDCEPFAADTPTSQHEVKRFVDQLRKSIDELRAAYPELLMSIKNDIQTCFSRPGVIGTARRELARSAGRVVPAIKDPRLKAFCLRLTDEGLQDDPWLESFGSFLCSKPPAKWVDHDLSRFEEELQRCARQYFRVESTLFDQGTGSPDLHAMRVSITCQDGSEVDKVIRLSDEELQAVTAIEERIRSLLNEDNRLGLIAATRAIMAQLQGLED